MGKKRAILIVALLAIIGGGAAAYFTRGSSDADGESVRTVNDGSGSGRATSTDSLVDEITATIYQMDRLQLDPSIFNSAAFRVLQDRTQIITPQEPGRENPFAPLYSDAATSSATSRTRAPSTGGGLINSNRAPTGGTAGTPPALPVR